MLGRLKAAPGVYAVLGNHDHWTDAALITDLFRAEGMTALINEGMHFELDGDSIWLAGVDDTMVGLEDLSLALAGARSDEMKLLLAHNPVILRRAARASVDLVLSGHTHGGQVAIRGERSASGRPRRRLLKGLGRQGDRSCQPRSGYRCYPSDTDALLKSLCWNSEATSKRDPRDRSVLTDIENVRAHHHCSQPSYCLPDGFDSGIRLPALHQRFVLALAVFIFAGITDGLDGLLARRFDQSQLGTILDPIADKLLLVTAFVASMRAVFPQPLPSHLPVPFWVTVAVISRDVFIPSARPLSTLSPISQF